jgi:hypothetical protein
MKAYQLKPWTQVATPHDDILRGELEISIYAADLAAVARQDPKCPYVYRDPKAFFDSTYITTALHSLLKEVLNVLAGGTGDRVLQLRTPFGGGKTHSLIALYHLTKERGKLKNNPELKELPDPGSSRVAVLHGLASDPHIGQKIKGGPHLKTLWGELAWQIGGAEGYELVKQQDKALTAPGGDVLRQLLGGKPTLILLDEILTYIEKAKAIQIHDTNFGRQNLIFLQTLTEVIRGLPNAAMVYSLQASVREAVEDESLLYTLDHLVSRIDAKREPVTGDEVMRVVQRRLFKELGDENIRRLVAKEYAELYRRLREGLGETESERRGATQEAAVLEERILASYPFHPDLLDLMYHRWGGLPSYQRTRGALQFLACVIHALWGNPQNVQPLIGPGDVPLWDDAVRGALFSQVGEREQYTSVIDADIIGKSARVLEVDKRIGQESPALKQLKVGTRLATAAFLYSFGARNGEDRGVVERELIASCLAPGLDRMVLSATLAELPRTLIYLHYTGRRFRFQPNPNLTKLIEEEEQKWELDEVLERIKGELKTRIRGEGGIILWPTDSQAVPDHDPQFNMVYMPLEWGEKDDTELDKELRIWTEQRGSIKREYRNALAFTVPSKQSADRLRVAARTLLAIESLIRQKTKFQFSEEQIEELKERRRNTGTDLDGNIRRLYEKVLLPVRERDGQEAYKLEVIDLRAQLSASQDIHGRILEALRNWVFDTVTPSKLLSLTHLGEVKDDTGKSIDYIPCDRLMTWFFSYLDFPKLLSVNALRRCIAKGVKDGRFGYVGVARLNEQGAIEVDKPRNVYFEQDIDPEEIDFSQGAYLLSADLASQLKTKVPAISSTEPTGVKEPEPQPTGEVPPTPVPTGKEVSPGQKARHYRLSMETDKAQAFQAFRVLQALSDKCSKMKLNIEVDAEAKDEFDPVWLRNAIEEPLDEADIKKETRLEE